MDNLVMFAMRIAQNIDVASDGYTGNGSTDHQVGPFAAQPEDKTARDQKAAIRDEIFEVERVRAFLAKNLRKYRRGTVAVQACHVEFAGIGHQVG